MTDSIIQSAREREDRIASFIDEIINSKLNLESDFWEVVEPQNRQSIALPKLIPILSKRFPGVEDMRFIRAWCMFAQNIPERLQIISEQLENEFRKFVEHTEQLYNDVEERFKSYGLLKERYKNLNKEHKHALHELKELRRKIISLDVQNETFARIIQNKELRPQEQEEEQKEEKKDDEFIAEEKKDEEEIVPEWDE